VMPVGKWVMMEGDGWREGGNCFFFGGEINNNLNFLPSYFFFLPALVSFGPFALFCFVLFGGCFVLIFDVIWGFFFFLQRVTDRCRSESGRGWKWVVNS